MLGIQQGREGSDEPGGEKTKKGKKKDKLLLASLFPHPSDVPFLLVVWKTLTPSCTNSVPPILAIVPIPVSPDLLHSLLHIDKWLGPGPAQMTHSTQRDGDDYERITSGY